MEGSVCLLQGPKAKEVGNFPDVTWTSPPLHDDTFINIITTFSDLLMKLLTDSDLIENKESHSNQDGDETDARNLKHKTSGHFMPYAAASPITISSCGCAWCCERRWHSRCSLGSLIPIHMPRKAADRMVSLNSK